MALRTLAAALACLMAVTTSTAREPADRARELLSATFGVGTSDMARIASGRVYSRTLAVDHDREVATLGIVRIATAPRRYVDLLTDIAEFKRDDKILQIGTFGTPPSPGDLADLTIDQDDIGSLRNCRVGECGVQLSAGAIDRFRTEVNWKAPDAPQQATMLLRRVLADYVTDYLASGSSAAMEYADTATRLSLTDEFSSLVAADTSTWPRVPSLRRHLLRFPSAKAEGAKDLVYWSKERVHRRPVVSVTHLAIVPGEWDSPVQYSVASRQIYAMHYFDVSLGITLLIPDKSASSPATYVVYLNRSRIDLFDGLWGGIARSVVKGRARSLVAEQLERLRETLETPGTRRSERP
jgi:hypothetical protein